MDRHGRAGAAARRRPRPPWRFPLGSGPYRLAKFEAGRSATYERVADYWGKDLPVNVGRNNFGTLRNEYFRDATVLIEALKGDLFDFRAENVRPQLGHRLRQFPRREGGPPDQGGVPRSRQRQHAGLRASTLRRAKFADPRVRRAFNLAMNFEEMNRALFFGLYKRIDSYYFGSELASSGLPEGDELAILESREGQGPGQPSSPRPTRTPSTARRRPCARTCARPSAS